MSATLLGLIAGVGTYLLVFPRRHPQKATSIRDQLRRKSETWLLQAGLENAHPAQFASAVMTIAAAAGLFGWLVFGAMLPAVTTAIFGAVMPIAIFRQRRERRKAKAREAWPRMIEELRVLTGSLGRSVPQALFEVGRRGPDELRHAFTSAEREWHLTTDFDRTLTVLRSRLADPTADAICETLAVAHQLGGADLDRRLAALAQDRIVDLNDRKDARAKQAGVRFARRFVLIVPAGMALIGLSIGNGREAYQTPQGQLGVLVALGALAGCWLWAGRLLQLPGESRAFGDSEVQP